MPRPQQLSRRRPLMCLLRPHPNELVINVRRSGTCNRPGMATNRTVYHVVPNSSADEWVISLETDDSFS
jgi:hypothetical protein